MTWNLNEKRPKVLLREPFSAKYTLLIDTNILSGGIELKSKAEIRWQVDVKNISDDGADINIITLHHRLLENNSPIINDVSGISNVFASMYNEIEVSVDVSGKVLRVNNLDTIKKKWQWVKQDMEALIEENEGFKDIISTNDELYASDEKIKMAVEANEFFEVYFHHFWGKALPGGKGNVFKYNLFNTSLIEWQYDLRQVSNNSLSDFPTKIKVTGTPVTIIGKDWVQKAYAAFSHLQLENPVPIFKDSAEYAVTPFGKVLNAKIERSEIVDSSLLFARYHYELIAENQEEDFPRTESLKENSGRL
ncbi:hypothetical protein DRF65_16100 [Chryseobacterium pennae]|uniref:Uncharacterized protein n=2 Tax=Chryseobacterium pennae TaxID=2258962 RepID=A0A3D9C6X9_9FLAO|nr:hypothetical protein DRF65_16100 [Chryseobacterium pennae]